VEEVSSDVICATAFWALSCDTKVWGGVNLRATLKLAQRVGLDKFTIRYSPVVTKVWI
jgi:hypothetical protein